MCLTPSIFESCYISYIWRAFKFSSVVLLTMLVAELFYPGTGHNQHSYFYHHTSPAENMAHK